MTTEDNWAQFVALVSVPTGRRGDRGQVEGIECSLLNGPLTGALYEALSLCAFEAQLSYDPLAGRERHAFLARCFALGAAVIVMPFGVIIG